MREGPELRHHRWEFWKNNPTKETADWGKTIKGLYREIDAHGVIDSPVVNITLPHREIVIKNKKLNKRYLVILFIEDNIGIKDQKNLLIYDYSQTETKTRRRMAFKNEKAVGSTNVTSKSSLISKEIMILNPEEQKAFLDEVKSFSFDKESTERLKQGLPAKFVLN
jgi:hypothetical protein